MPIGTCTAGLRTGLLARCRPGRPRRTHHQQRGRDELGRG